MIRIDGLAQTIGFESLDEPLRSDVRESLEAGFAAGAVFGTGTDPLSVYRAGIAQSIKDIDSSQRQRLQRFLTDGPYEEAGPIPADLTGKRLSDEEVASAVRLIFFSIVNQFQGCLAEFLAVRPCLRLLDELKAAGRLPGEAVLYGMDAARASRLRTAGAAKAADLLILSPPTLGTVGVLGVAEVKSYVRSRPKLLRQIGKHLDRARQGLHIDEVIYGPGQVKCPVGTQRAVRIAIVPARWHLSRKIVFTKHNQGRLLEADAGVPPEAEDRVQQLDEDTWLIALRWSREALAATTYEMTLWYMEKLGETLYPDRLPQGWEAMTAAQAGRNAAKMMLYYAIQRARTAREEQRAIALYNTYGFGYALGMGFRDKEGRRDMLWPEDLDEIAAAGVTKHGCRVS